jgi:hypothetical protein
LIANQLNIKKGGFNDLFHQELPKLPINQRIQQFYRLALLMHRDGILHIKAEAIKQTAIRMGLNQKPLNEFLKKWKMRPM